MVNENQNYKVFLVPELSYLSSAAVITSFSNFPRAIHRFHKKVNEKPIVT